MKIIEHKTNINQMSPDVALRLGLVQASDAAAALKFLSSWRIAPSTVKAWQETEQEIKQAVSDDPSIEIDALEALEIFFREVLVKSINTRKCADVSLVKITFPQIGSGVVDIDADEAVCDGFAHEVVCFDALELTMQISTLQALVSFSVCATAAEIAFGSKEGGNGAVQ